MESKINQSETSNLKTPSSSNTPNTKYGHPDDPSTRIYEPSLTYIHADDGQKLPPPKYEVNNPDSKTNFRILTRTKGFGTTTDTWCKCGLLYPIWRSTSSQSTLQNGLR